MSNARTRELVARLKTTVSLIKDNKNKLQNDSNQEKSQLIRSINATLRTLETKLKGIPFDGKSFFNQDQSQVLCEIDKLAQILDDQVQGALSLNTQVHAKNK